MYLIILLYAHKLRYSKIDNNYDKIKQYYRIGNKVLKNQLTKLWTNTNFPFKDKKVLLYNKWCVHLGITKFRNNNKWLNINLILGTFLYD